MSASQASTATFASRPAHLRLQQVFFPCMALLIIAAVFLGFARTFFLAPIYHYHLPNMLVAIHGVVFASWIALFAIQTSLVATDHVDIHKYLGLLGAVLVGLVFILGYATMLEGLHRGFSIPGQPFNEKDEAQILALDLIGINVSFAMFVAGLLLRRSPEFHKRLMFFGTVGMLGPAVARWPFEVIAFKPPLVGLVLQSFSVAMIVFDLTTKRGVHRATWIGIATLFVVPAIAVPMSATPLWYHFLSSVKQLLTKF